MLKLLNNFIRHVHFIKNSTWH